MRPTLDLVVVGGGPAGLAAAIAGRLAGLSVRVVEMRDGELDKACGEGLLPHGRAALAALGVRGVDGVRLAGVRYALADDPACSAEGRFPAGGALGVRRTTLVHALRGRAEDLGVRFVHDRIVRVADDGERVVASGREAHRARFVVAADGLRSTLRCALGLDASPPGGRFGVRRHFRVRPWSEHVEVTFAPGVEAYVTPVGHDMVGVAFLVGRPQPFEALLARFPRLRARLAQSPAASRMRGAGPFGRRARRVAEGRVLLVGDAAGYVDPLTGEGVATGLATARAAVGCIVRGEPEAYAGVHREIVRRADALTEALLAVTRYPSLHRPLVLAARAMPRAFDRALAVLSGVDQDPDAPAPERPFWPEGGFLEATCQALAARAARAARA